MSGAKLAEALVKAQASVHAVGKDGVNTFHKYRYATAESLVEEGRAALGAAGLSLSPVTSSVQELSPAYDTATPDGPSRVVAQYILDAVFLLEHVSGESRSVHSQVPIIPEKGRPLDKATAAARTFLLGYLLRDLLLIPRSDEAAGAADARDDRPRPAPASAPAAGVETYATRIAAAKDLRELAQVGRELGAAALSDAQKQALRGAWVEREQALKQVA